MLLLQKLSCKLRLRGELWCSCWGLELWQFRSCFRPQQSLQLLDTLCQVLHMCLCLALLLCYLIYVTSRTTWSLELHEDIERHEVKGRHLGVKN
jgi:hypothetical protein